MASTPIVAWFVGLTQIVSPTNRSQVRPDLHTLGANPVLLPPFVRESAVALRYLNLLSPLAWDRFPELNLAWQPAPIPYAALAAACLVKLDQQLVSMGRLRQYLVEHPGLLWLCGFPVQPFDAFYVYQYFHEAGGFAAVPFSEKGGRKKRGFSPDGRPLCAVGLAMPLKFAFTDRTSTLVVHQRGKYVCPLRHPHSRPPPPAPSTTSAGTRVAAPP